MELEERIRDLEHQRLIAKVIQLDSYQTYSASKKETDLLMTECHKATLAYEKLDLELAEIDGRFTRIPSPKPGSKRKSNKPTKIEPAQMTMDQVRALAKRVGIELKED